jgi:TRAP-type C4-dicarboxylate transport system permease small subunit
MNWIRRFNSQCERLLGTLLAFLVAGVVLVVIWQVLTRLAARVALAYDFAPILAPARWTEELASFGLAWVAMLGAAYALRRGEHIGLDVLYQRFGESARARVDRVVQFAVVVFALALAGGGAMLVALTLELGQRTPALGWPMGAVYVVLPLSGLLMLAFAAERAIGAGGDGLN